MSSKTENQIGNPLPLNEKRENIFFDTRRLVIIDSNNILNQKNNEKELTETIMINKAKQNYISFASSLFNLLEKQHGKENEDLDYDKAPDELTLPEAIITLPRSLPIPVAKPLTKWEKYKQEKGITQRKRSRMVYSEEVGDWVPRWGRGSVKKIQDSMNWAMEEKEPGVNPFEQKSNEKQLAKAKQLKRQIKNEEYAKKVLNSKKEGNNSGTSNINDFRNDNKSEPKQKLSKKQRKALKAQKEIQKLNDDKKNLSKRLEQVQKSTRSMGNFDKKLKNEKEVNLLKKKRVSKEVLSDKNKEKSRDKRILDNILKNAK
jgi:regulator of ribosome biosynthesis